MYFMLIIFLTFKSLSAHVILEQENDGLEVYDSAIETEDQFLALPYIPTEYDQRPSNFDPLNCRNRFRFHKHLASVHFNKKLFGCRKFFKRKHFLKYHASSHFDGQSNQCRFLLRKHWNFNPC